MRNFFENELLLPPSVTVVSVVSWSSNLDKMVDNKFLPFAIFIMKSRGWMR